MNESGSWGYALAAIGAIAIYFLADVIDSANYRRRKRMLIVTRRPHEKLIIVTPSGEKITVAVLAMHGNQAKLGVDAPPATTVDREEIYDRKQTDKSRA